MKKLLILMLVVGLLNSCKEPIEGPKELTPKGKIIKGILNVASGELWTLAKCKEDKKGMQEEIFTIIAEAAPEFFYGDVPPSRLGDIARAAIPTLAAAKIDADLSAKLVIKIHLERDRGRAGQVESHLAVDRESGLIGLRRKRSRKGEDWVSFKRNHFG